MEPSILIFIVTYYTAIIIISEICFNEEIRRE